MAAGDLGFVGVSMREDPRLLADGLASVAVNKDFRDRSADTRRGFETVRWAHELGVSFPIPHFPFSFTEPQGFGEIFGSLAFSDPESGREFTLLACAFGTYILEANAEPSMILYPPADDGVSGPVTMIQAFNVILMYRGTRQETIKWDPYDDARWVYVAQTDAPNTDEGNGFSDGTDPIPATDEAVVFAGRVFAKDNRDELVASDIFDYTRYSNATARFRINDGDAGEIVRVWPFNQQQLIVFKDRRIHLLGNVGGDLSSITSDILTTEFGCAAKNTVVTVGSDVWFLAQGGIYSVAQALDNKLQANSEPISKPVEPLMRRINWAKVSNACAVYFENRYYLAVPVDGAAYNNLIIVFDYINRAWMGSWVNEWMDVQSFVRMKSGGALRLFMVMGGHVNSKAEGTMVRLGDGLNDELFGSVSAIEDELLSRGYSIDNRERMTTQIGMELSTRQPNMTVSLVMPSVGDEQILAENETRDPLKYYSFGKADWDPSNVNGDHGSKGRQDYAVVFPEESGVDFDLTFPIDFTSVVYPPFNPDLSQRTRRVFRCSGYADFVQVRVQSAGGRCKVHGIGIM